MPDQQPHHQPGAKAQHRTTYKGIVCVDEPVTVIGDYVYYPDGFALVERADGIRLSARYSDLHPPPADPRDPSRDEILATAREIDPEFNTDAENAPGAWERTDDVVLCRALDTIALHGVADRTGGHPEWSREGARIGRYVIWTDEEGFRTLSIYGSWQDADMAIDEADAAWSTAEAVEKAKRHLGVAQEALTLLYNHLQAEAVLMDWGIPMALEDVIEELDTDMDTITFMPIPGLEA